jgi:hypothetical protein
MIIAQMIRPLELRSRVIFFENSTKAGNGQFKSETRHCADRNVEFLSSFYHISNLSHTILMVPEKYPCQAPKLSKGASRHF